VGDAPARSLPGVGVLWRTLAVVAGGVVLCAVLLGGAAVMLASAVDVSDVPRPPTLELPAVGARLAPNESICRVTSHGNDLRRSRGEPVDEVDRVYGEEPCKPGDQVVLAR
jgi:hypothetical protein